MATQAQVQQELRRERERITQGKLPQPEPPSLAEQDSPEVGALKAALEDLHQTNEDLQHALEAARASSSMTEAPASLNFYGVTAKGWNVQYTIRDASDDALIARFGQVLKKMEQFNIQPKPVGQQPATTTAEAAPAPAQLPPLPGLPTPQAAPAPTNGSGVQTIHAIKLEVTPLPDGKAKLVFYEAGHQYPDISSTQSVDRLLALLAPTGGWTAQHLGVAQAFNVTLDVDWKPSDKLNSSGKPYKDIVAIRPRA